MYAPTGSVLAERSMQGPLIFGVRKSLFYKSEEARTNYTLAKDLLTSGKPGAQANKMEDIAALFN